MDITIEKGSLKYLHDCIRALADSELGRQYFSAEASAERAIQEGLDQGTLYVALVQGICVGFAWYLPNGVFHGFPYLHIIAVSAECRGKGIGRALMGFVENLVLPTPTNYFWSWPSSIPRHGGSMKRQAISRWG